MMAKVVEKARDLEVKNNSFEVRFDATIKRFADRMEGLEESLARGVEHKVFEVGQLLIQPIIHPVKT